MGNYTTNEKDEEEEALKNDEIFQKLCPDSSFKNDNNCTVCAKAFGMLSNRKKNCRFCGASVCDDCSLKRRADPQKQDNFVRICDNCDQKYINRYLLREYKYRQQKLDSVIETLEKQLQEYILVLNQKKQELQNIKNLRSKKKEQFEKEVSQQDKEIDM